jgi:XTP/dITP diphosphohydrolase
MSSKPRSVEPGGEPLLLATTNPAKLERLRWVFAGLRPVRPLPADTPAPPDESGQTFRQNAELKARYWSSWAGGPAAASDGGLVIPALGDRWEALRTGRAAGPGATDSERAAHLLELAAGLVGEQRKVFWVEALAIAQAGALVKSWESSGTTAYLLSADRMPALKPGFWAASLCYVPALGKTLAELADEQLPEVDPTWSGLRDQIQADLASGQSDQSAAG